MKVQFDIEEAKRKSDEDLGELVGDDASGTVWGVYPDPNRDGGAVLNIRCHTEFNGESCTYEWEVPLGDAASAKVMHIARDSKPTSERAIRKLIAKHIDVAIADFEKQLKAGFFLDDAQVHDREQWLLHLLDEAKDRFKNGDRRMTKLNHQLAYALRPADLMVEIQDDGSRRYGLWTTDGLKPIEFEDIPDVLRAKLMEIN